MIINVCYRDSTSTTGIRIANHLQETLGQDIMRGEKPIKDAFNISWGYQGEEDYIYLNNPKAIRETVDKFKFNTKLERAGCPVPKCYHYKGIMWLYKKNKIHLPLIARRNKMQGGNGMRVCLCKAQISGAIRDDYEYFKEYIKPKNEFRVHIFNGSPILVIRKDYAETYNVTRNDEEEHIVERGIRPQLLKVAKQAMKSSSLTFGAVDIIEGEDNKFYILEINSAPALNKRMREPYVREIVKVLKERCVI